MINPNLNINQSLVKEQMESPDANIEVTPEIEQQSMENLDLTPDITEEEVQAVIDKMYELGYLTASFDAKEIMAID